MPFQLGRMRIMPLFFWLHIRNCFYLCWLIHDSQCLHYSLMRCSSPMQQYYTCILSHYTGSIFVTTQGSIRRNGLRYRVYHFQEYLAHRRVASHAGVFRGARVSSLPTNACSTENNNSFLIVPEFGKYNVIG